MKNLRVIILRDLQRPDKIVEVAGTDFATRLKIGDLG